MNKTPNSESMHIHTTPQGDKGKPHCPHRGNKVVAEEMATADVWLVTDYRRGPAGASLATREDLKPTGKWSVSCVDCHQTWRGNLAQVSKAPSWVRNAIYTCRES